MQTVSEGSTVHRRGGEHLLLAAFILVGALLAASNIILLHVNQSLQRKADLLHTPIGLKPPPLRGTSLDGRQIEIRYPREDAETLLFVFSPTCPACKTMWPKWSEIAAACSDKRLVYVNERGDITPTFLASFHPARGDYIAKTDPQSIVDYYLRETPITVLISAQGMVTGSWEGDLDAADVKGLEREVGCRQE